MSRSRFLPLATVLAIACAAPAEARLPAPALSTPGAEASVQAPPAFTWGAVKGAEQYEFQLAADRRFSSIVLGSGSGRGSFRTRNTAATIYKSIPDGTYYWRVRALDSGDNAGQWTGPRKMVKAWTTAPELQGPADDLSVSWPVAPLVLQWTEVPYAVKYIVTIATDPQLASQVLGSTKSPVKTRGSVFALPSSLAPGQYYWAITPVDANGHLGTRSRVGRFTWNWPTSTAVQFTDLNEDARVVDPEFSWDAIPGAARYDVEVNPDSDWAIGSKVCCTDRTTGTSLSPLNTLKDNTYHWRVRGVDADGNAGRWNVGADFVKNFDAVVPSIPNLRVRDNTNTDLNGAGTNTPIVTWDPVPGASGYEVQAFPRTGSGCDFASNAVDDVTVATAWTPLAGFLADIGPDTWPDPSTGGQSALFPSSGTKTYCVLVRAYSEHANGFISLPTSIDMTLSPLPLVDTTTPSPAQASDFLAPVNTTTPREPVFRWQPMAHANAYQVIIARDPDFIHVIDRGNTRVPAYAPREVPYTDETTSYYWTVVPYNLNASQQTPDDGTAPPPGATAAFEKQSVPPTPLSPVNDADVTAQPRFRWTPAEGARAYELQVSQDPTFGETIDKVTTESTSYTSSATYPADTALYWRVRATDGAGAKLTWSSTATFRRRLIAPTIAEGNPTGGDRIPVLSWNPVPGAVSYDMHVDKVTGQTQDLTLRSTSFTPTEFYGNGIWRWRVRANFPSGATGTVASGYTDPQTYVRQIGATSGVKGTKTARRVLITWTPDPSASAYRVQISRSDGFSSPIQTVNIDTTAFAPDLTNHSYSDGGTLYWRVASTDGGNVGAYTSGRFTFPRTIRFKVEKGSYLRSGKASTITLRLTDSKGHRLRNVAVRASGAGVHARGRSNRRGIVRLFVRPTRSGVVTFIGSGRRLRPSSMRLRVF